MPPLVTAIPDEKSGQQQKSADNATVSSDGMIVEISCPSSAEIDGKKFKQHPLLPNSQSMPSMMADMDPTASTLPKSVNRFEVSCVADSEVDTSTTPSIATNQSWHSANVTVQSQSTRSTLAPATTDLTELQHKLSQILPNSSSQIISNTGDNSSQTGATTAPGVVPVSAAATNSNLSTGNSLPHTPDTQGSRDSSILDLHQKLIALSNERNQGRGLPNGTNADCTAVQGSSQILSNESVNVSGGGSDVFTSPLPVPPIPIDNVSVSAANISLSGSINSARSEDRPIVADLAKLDEALHLICNEPKRDGGNISKEHSGGVTPASQSVQQQAVSSQAILHPTTFATFFTSSPVTQASTGTCVSASLIQHPAHQVLENRHSRFKVCDIVFQHV